MGEVIRWAAIGLPVTVLIAITVFVAALARCVLWRCDTFPFNK